MERLTSKNRESQFTTAENSEEMSAGDVISSYQEKLQEALKGKKQFEERQQALEPHSDMTEMLELSDKEFETMIII